MGARPRSHRVCEVRAPRQLFCLSVALFMLPAVFARSAGAQQSPQFRARVDLVQLQVGVSDDDGGFVSGLNPGDFIVVVDGDPRPAQVAYEIDLRDKGGGGASAVGRMNQVATAGSPVAARRHFVLFFDFSFTTGRGLREERRAALGFLDNSLHPSDLLAVATVDRYGVDLLVPFTSDRGQVRQFVAGLRLADVTDKILFEDCLSYVAAVSNYVAQLEVVGEMMQAIEGRKHLVMFSTGFSDRVVMGRGLEALSVQAEARASGSSGGRGIADLDECDTGSSDVRASMEAAVQEFLEADVVIHAIDPRGLRRYSGDGHQALTYFADGTGGEAYWNRNNLTPALEQIEETTARFYLIGYQKQATDAGTVEIEVRVLRPGVKITAAPERLTPPPEYVHMNAVQRQLQLAEAMADDLDVRRIAVETQVVPFPAQGGDSASVVLFFEIPGLELERLAAMRGADEITLEIAGFALANDDTLVDQFRGVVGIDVASMRAAGPMIEQAFRYADVVEVPPGEGRLRLLLRESVIGEITVATRRYHALGRQEPGRMIVARPMIVDDVGLPALPKQDRPFDPLLFNQRRLAPIADPQVTLGEAVDVLILLYNVARHPVSGEIAAWVSVDLQDADSGDLYLYPISDFRILSTSGGEDGGATQLLVRIPIPDHVRPGDAQLWVRITDPITGESREEQTRLFVRPR